MPDMNAEARQAIVEQLRQSRKYRHCCGDTLDRIAGWALARHHAPKDALKAAKRKLHQVYGAYFDRFDWKRIEEFLFAIEAGAGVDTLRDVCGEILRSHASTRERLPIMEQAFGTIFECVGRIERVVDLACGLNPFALPWMPLPESCAYEAIDIDERLMAILGTFFERAGRRGTAQCRDMLVSPPDTEADVVLLLKLLPCLEQQEKGAALALLRSLRARYAVVSFPLKSLGGRSKGMAAHYGAFMDDLVEVLDVPAQVYPFENEVFYLLTLW
ncbi:MAG: hypothetical protein GWP08_05145 [Nitrospiraceae bacterium]|nr:hypothetical protein [Nitrospiraceae bacterium]